jgi:hypothetical protein
MRRQSDRILDFISRYSLDTWPLRSLTPVVRPGDPDWRDYYGSLNAPHHYHNGGVLPFLGGFYVAALVKAGRGEAAAVALQSLAHLNHCGQFKEWHHGETGAPMGAQDQAWSAGTYLFAWECVRGGTGVRLCSARIRSVAKPPSFPGYVRDAALPGTCVDLTRYRTKQMVLRELVENLERGKATRGGRAVVNRACELLGKHLGMFQDGWPRPRNTEHGALC